MSKEKILRDRIIMCVLGSMHKTDIVMNFIPSWIKNNPDGYMIVFDPKRRVVPEFNNKVSCIIDNDKDFLWADSLLEKYKGKKEIPKLLILNGGDILFPKPKDNKIKEQYPELKGISRPSCHRRFTDILAMSRYLNMDIVITFPTPDSIPMVIERYVTNFFILPILEEYELDRRSPYYFSMYTCIKTINHYSKTYGRDFKKEYLSFSTYKDGITATDAIDKKKFNKTIKKFKVIKKRVSVEI